MKAGLHTLLLSGLALATLPALAQTHAPADDKPGRIVLLPMSVERPGGPGWAPVRRTDTELVLVRPAENNRNSAVAIASGKVPERRAHTAAELAENIRIDLKKQLDGKRFDVLTEDVRADAARGDKCVGYRQLARDLGAKGADGKAQFIDLHGLACLHPADDGIVLVATLSERGAEESRRAGLAEDAARFFAGVRPHAPLKGQDWLPLAEKGDANAAVWLARALLQAGKAGEAIPWLEQAAGKGHPEAEALLGLAYLTGRGIDRAPAEALKRLKPAAEKGYPRAEGLLAIALLNAGEVRDEAEGRRWARKAAADGDPAGQALLGELLLFGRAGMEKNETEGAAWMRKAAEQADARAQYMLASLLANGLGVGKDPIQARFWLELAAAQGNPEARKILEQNKRPPAAAASPGEGK
ncbi:MAG: sel1 repeat family protein [Zoogloeaceae bacterium]|nr:sel1 repeat family protein [Zoogloeaceae bacterium]MCK6384671.1 sel1 repeat family protein [Rhodocyclaceae bacterium]